MKRKYEKQIQKAEKLYEAGKLSEAAEAYEQTFNEQICLKDYLMLGYLYIDLENYLRAEEIFQDILSRQDCVEALFGLANIYERTKRFDQAITYYEKVIHEDHQIVDAYFACAYLYDEMEKEITSIETQKAIEYYQKTIELEPKHFWAYLNLGSIYERNNQDDLALQYFLKAYEIDSNMPTVCYNLGVVYGKKKEKDLALQYYLEELTKKDYYPFTYFNLGILYKDLFHDYGNAKQAYLNGLKVDKNNFSIWYNLGCLYSLMNQYQDAYECFLYLYYKKKEYISSLKDDEELEEFRKTTYYQKLIHNEV